MSTTTATHRMNYSEYVADITGSPKTTRRSANIAIIKSTNQFLNRQNPEIQQTGAMPQYGGGIEKCPRCSKTVYLAEKKVAAGRSFHSSCFSCQTCKRKLDATTLSEHKGEIYCKRCYTRQFGVHGLAHGVTMTTEHPVHVIRHSRRSSYGNDLDTPVIKHEPTRQRAHSNDNILRGEHSAVYNDELPKVFPWRNDFIPENYSSTTNNSNSKLDHNDNSHYHRPTSQIGFQRHIGSTDSDNNYHQSTNSTNDDQNKDVFDDEKGPFGGGISAIVDIPVISTPERSNSTIDQINIPILSTNDELIQSSSTTSTGTYQRQTSREYHIDTSDHISRFSSDDTQMNVNNQKYSNENTTTNTIVSNDSLMKQTYFHSSSYENQYKTSNTTNLYPEQSHSGDSSPSVAVDSNRSATPMNSSGSSGIHGEDLSHDLRSATSDFVPSYDYFNDRSSKTIVVDRRPSSPQQNERPMPVVNELVSKTNTLPSPSAGGKYATISALVPPHRPLLQPNTTSDDGFNNYKK